MPTGIVSATFATPSNTALALVCTRAFYNNTTVLSFCNFPFQIQKGIYKKIGILIGMSRRDARPLHSIPPVNPFLKTITSKCY